jgi:hypothetical protein
VERLVILVFKLLLQLAWVLLKFVLRLVLFAWSGDWHKLDKIAAEVREALEQAKQGSPPAAPSPRARSKSARAPRTSTPGKAGGPWPFEFSPELTELEPAGELEGGEHDAAAGEMHGGEWVGGESVIQPTKSFRPVTRRGPAMPPPPPVSLARAVRDPRALRDAMVLTAALGPRGRSARRF